MITKIIREPKNAKGVLALGKYVLGASRDAPSLGLERLGAYVIGEANNDGEIVTHARTTNCDSAEFGKAIWEMARANAENTSSRASKTYHIVISLVPGEELTEEQFDAAEQRYVEALGMQDCKRISATHRSKEHLHRHICIATASGPDRNNIRPSHDYAKVDAVTVALEKEYGLTICNHERGTGEARVGSFLEYAKDRADELKLAGSWAELHEIAAEHGLFVKPHGAGLVIGSTGNRKLHVRASRVDRGLSHQALLTRFGEFTVDTVAREGQTVSDERTGYDRLRKENRYQTQKAIRELREAHRAKTDEIAAFYRNRITDELKRYGPHMKQARKLNVGIIVQQREEAQRKRRDEHRRQRRALVADRSFPEFEVWAER